MLGAWTAALSTSNLRFFCKTDLRIKKTAVSMIVGSLLVLKVMTHFLEENIINMYPLINSSLLSTLTEQLCKQLTVRFLVLIETVCLYRIWWN